MTIERSRPPTAMVLRTAGRRLQLAVGAGLTLIALLLALLVQAAFTDTAGIRADLESRFELAVLEDSGGIAQLGRESDSTVRFTSTTALVPGAQLRIPIILANNSSAHSTRPELRIAAVGHRRAADLSRLLKASVIEDHRGTETVLLGDGSDPARGVGLDRPIDLRATRLSPRTGPAQTVGEEFTGGDTARAAYSVLIALADDPLFRDLDGASWTITLTIEGTSGS